MKKFLLALLIVSSFSLETEAAVLVMPTSNHSEIIAKTTNFPIFGRRKGYRKKRGFLWGLFRKKGCGCPKH